MGRHIRVTSREKALWSIPPKAWCPSGVNDAFCYDITCEDGMKGMLVTGGFAGVHEFTAWFPCLKDDTCG